MTTQKFRNVNGQIVAAALHESAQPLAGEGATPPTAECLKVLSIHPHSSCRLPKGHAGECGNAIVGAAPQQTHAETLEQWAKRFRMSYTERFETDADAFYRATGFLAPGNSQPVEMCQGEAHEARRQEAWNAWITEKNSILVNALEAGAAALRAPVGTCETCQHPRPETPQEEK